MSARPAAAVVLSIAASVAVSAGDLRFFPDPGVRVEQASNPEAGIDAVALSRY